MGNQNKKGVKNLQDQTNTKVRFPRGDEFIGVVEKRLGGSRMYVRNLKGEKILARVPGRAKKFLWIREGNIVLLKPWELDKGRADLFYKYKPNEINILKKKNILTEIETVEEF